MYRYTLLDIYITCTDVVILTCTDIYVTCTDYMHYMYKYLINDGGITLTYTCFKYC